MRLAPIAVSAYSRLYHLKQTIEALQKNTLAKESELYIFSDAPKVGDEEEVKKVRSYIHTIDGFKTVNIVEKTTNGRVNSVRGGVCELLEKYGRTIFMEDDIVTAPGFLQYMNDALNIYEKDEKIFSISGYSPPINIPTDYRLDTFILRRSCAWGYGIWQDRFKKISYLDYAEVLKRFSNKREVDELSKYGEDLLNMILLDAAGKIDAFDVKIFYYQFLNDKYTIYPRKSLVRNIGLDGSGMHCGKTKKFDFQLWGKLEFEINANVELDDRIVKSNYEFRKIRDLPNNLLKKPVYSLKQGISETDKIDEKLIFLISQPRAGSTLLQRILNGHPDIHTTAEPWFMLHPLYALRENGLVSEFDSELARIGLEDFISQLPDGKELYFKAVSRMAGTLYNRMLEVSGKKYFLDKTPRYHLIIPELKNVFPKARFIILLRNPLAVLSSTLKSWFQNNPEKFQKSLNYLDVIRGPLNLIQGIQELKEKAIVVRYEELVEDTETTVRAICYKLGIEYQNEMLNYGSKPIPKGRFGDTIGIIKHSTAVPNYIEKWVMNFRSRPLYDFASKYMKTLGPEVFNLMGYPFQENSDKLERSLNQGFRADKMRVAKACKQNSIDLKYLAINDTITGLKDLNNRNDQSRPSCRGCREQRQPCSFNKAFLVSAIVSCYNSEKFIRGCLEDLETQTIAEKLEIIVIDSGSEQNECAVVDEFMQRYSNIKYIRKENRETIYAAWNRGIKAATGKYVVNANTDDRLRCDALEIMARTLEENASVGVVYIDQVRTNYPNETFGNHHTNGFLQRAEPTIEIMIEKNPCGPQVMWRRTLHDQIGYFRSDYEVAGDWDFWLRVVFETPFKILHINELLGLYYYNLDGLEHGGRKQRERLSEIKVIKEKYGKLYQASLNSPVSDHGYKTNKKENELIRETTDKGIKNILPNRKKAKNILLTTSAAPAQTPFSTTEKRAPIGIGFLISILRNAGHNVFFIDNYLKPFDFLETDYLQANAIEFVGIYANTICYRDTLRMLYKLEWHRQTGRWNGKIIVGGPHTTVCPDTIPDFVDYVVQGEGENAIVDIVDGNVKERIVKYPRLKNLDELPMPAWDYFINLPYNWSGDFFPQRPVFSMNTSRGCPFSCKFCSVNSIWGKRYTYFSADRIVADIEYLVEKYGAKGIYFREDNFTLNHKRLMKFCNLLKEKNIRISWACETRVNTLDEEIVKLMSETGACGFYLGVESGSQKILNFLKKEITVDQTREAFRLCHKYGIKTAASVVVGVPTETTEDLNATLALLSEVKPTVTWFNVFVGIPNSELYQYTLDSKLHEFIDDRGLVYLKGHNERVKAFYGGEWDARIPVNVSQDPDISVIMSVFNGENYLKEAVASILNQTYQNFEFIVINDASTDRTLDILKSFDDPRINIINNSENCGLTESLNTAIQSARGKYIARMDADDISLPHRLERQLEFLEKNQGYALVGSSYYLINESGKIDRLINVLTDAKELKKGLKNQNWFGHGSVMMRRKNILEKGGYNVKFKYAQDYDLWLRIADSHKLANIEEPLYCWRATHSGISRKKEVEQRSYAEMAVFEAHQRDAKNDEADKRVPLISVIVPTFNRPQMLKAAIQSILSQTYQNFEIIVVNDAGEDVYEFIRKLNDQRILYIQHEKNKGLAASRNTGIKNASGRYIALLDDDDIFYPEHLQLAVKWLSDSTPVIYTDAVRATYSKFGDTYKLTKKHVPYSFEFDRNKLLVGNISPVNCFVFDKELAFKVGLFDETLSTLEDWDFWIRLSSSVPFKHLAQPTVQVNWRTDGTTMTSLLGSEFKKNRERIYRKYQDEINRVPNLQAIMLEFQKIWANDFQNKSGLTSIVILTCNQINYTKKCIESIFKYTSSPYELIVVDNGSTDGTVEYLESEVLGRHTDARIEIIKNNENKGFACGNNQGMASARGDYILLMNNDVVVTPGWLGRLIACAEKKPDIGIVGPRSNYVSGHQLVEAADYETNTLSGLSEFSHKFADEHAGQARQILRVVGFCMLIKRAVIDKIGGMDDRYGLGNFEDDDFSLRATIAGFESWMAMDCFIHHFGHRTFLGEKVDIGESLHKNWGLFKEKWGLPANKPYGSPYHLSEMKNTQFDPSIHYYPLDKDGDTMEKSNNDFKSAENLYNAIQANLNIRSSTEIIKDLQDLIASHPEFAPAYSDLGILYYSSGNREKTLIYYEKAVQLNPENIVFQKNLADFYYAEMGKVEDALRIYVKILEAYPKDVETLLITGHICVSLHKFEDAKVFYRRVLELEPGNEDARNNLAKLDQIKSIEPELKSPEEMYQDIQPLLNNGDPYKAIASLENLLEHFPKFAPAHNDLGVLYYHTGDQEKAQRRYERAVELMPDNMNFLKNLADFYCVELGRIEDALQIYVNILKTDPRDIETLLATGQICKALEKFDDARDFFKQVLEIEPWNADARNQIEKMEEQSEKKDAEHKTTASIVISLDGIQNRVIECLQSIQAHTPEAHELLLVARGATKSMLKWAQQLVKDNDHYHIIECTGQNSWTECINQAVLKATGDIVVLLHNDVVLSEGWLNAFIRCINLEPHSGVVGPISNRTAGVQLIVNADESSRTEFETAAKAFYEQNQYRRVRILNVSAFCMVFRRNLIETIGPFDEQFVSEEVAVDDFCTRAVSAGFQNLIAADIYVFHYDRHPVKNNASTKNSAGAEDRKKYQGKWNSAENPASRSYQTVQLLARADELSQSGKVDAAVEVLLGGIGVQPEEPRFYIALSEILLAAKRFQDAKDALAEMPSGGTRQEMRKAELMGYAEEGLKNYVAAQTHIESLLAMNPDRPSALNLKGILAYRNGDRGLAEKHFKRAIDADPGYGEPYTNLGMLSLEADRPQDALRFIEKAFRLNPADLDIATNYHSLIAGTAEFERAEDIAREAAVLYPNNQKIKYMLIDLLIHQGNYDEAMTEIEAAIVKFGIEDGVLAAALKVREELGPITIQTNTQKASISLCMIIKDEEKYLARCLASVKPVVDEMIVVDTGSKDRSKDIAVTFGARVYEYEWQNDFAAARNYSISKASGDWILILDGDEVISPLDYDLFNKIVSKKPKAPIAYSITTRNYNQLANIVGWMPNDGRYPDEEAAIGWLPSEKVRLFYGRKQIWFEGAVHELVDPILKRNGIAIKKCSIPVHHYGRLDKEKLDRKGEIYFDIGQKKLAEMGEDVNALRELAIQATILERNQEALELWQRLLALNPFPQVAAIAYVNIGTIYNRLGKFGNALEAGKMAVECCPDLKEARYNLAMAELHCGNAHHTISILDDLLNGFPDYPPARFMLSAAYCCVDQKEKGLEGIRNLKSTPVGAHLEMPCIELAHSLISANQVKYALGVLEAAIECDIINKEILDLFNQCIKMREDNHELSEMGSIVPKDHRTVILEHLPH